MCLRKTSCSSVNGSVAVIVEGILTLAPGHVKSTLCVSLRSSAPLRLSFFSPINRRGAEERRGTQSSERVLEVEIRLFDRALLRFRELHSFPRRNLKRGIFNADRNRIAANQTTSLL